MDRAALLLVHPLGGTPEFWDELKARIGNRFEWHAPATAGGIDTQVAQLELHVRNCGLASTSAIGCAVGAMVAIAYAARFPQRVARLVLANPALRMPPANAALLRERAAGVRRDGLSAILPGAVDRAFEGVPRDARHAAHLERLAKLAPADYARSVEALVDADVGAEAARVGCPTLVVAGAHDVQFPPHCAREVHEAIAGSELLILPHASHFAPLQDPDGFAGRMLEFLSHEIS